MQRYGKKEKLLRPRSGVYLEHKSENEAGFIVVKVYGDKSDMQMCKVCEIEKKSSRLCEAADHFRKQPLFDENGGSCDEHLKQF